MQLYTYQSPEAYERLMRDGVLHITEEDQRLTMAFREDWKAYARDAYDYMTDRMRYTVGPPPAGVVYPIWAWYKWGDRRDPLPEHDENYAGKKCITFRVDRRRVLLSDFHLFGFYVFNGLCLPMNEAEQEMIDALPVFEGEPGKSLYEAYKRATWDRIFQLNWRDDTGYMFGSRCESVQATLWELRREQVISVRDV